MGNKSFLARIVTFCANPFAFPTGIPIGSGYESMNESEPCMIGILVEKANRQKI